MKKIRKLKILPEKMIKNDEMVNFKGGYGTYMHMGWCPNSWLKWGTYCNETYSADLCDNPTC